MDILGCGGTPVHHTLPPPATRPDHTWQHALPPLPQHSPCQIPRPYQYDSTDRRGAYTTLPRYAHRFHCPLPFCHPHTAYLPHAHHNPYPHVAARTPTYTCAYTTGRHTRFGFHPRPTSPTNTARTTVTTRTYSGGLPPHAPHPLPHAHRVH